MHHSALLMSEMGRVSRVSLVQTALRNYTRDEGRSFEVGNQVLISSHRASCCGQKPRWRALRKRRDKIPAGTVERGERKRTAAEVSKAV